MNDRQLLEDAARAAGIEVIRSRLDDPMWRDMLIRQSARNPHHENGSWNPLTDDGDALRLAVKLRIPFHVFDRSGIAYGKKTDAHPEGYDAQEFYESDPYAATRRAIVRAAAAGLAP